MEEKKHLFSCGHTACAGCGQAIGARLVVDAAGPDTIATNATGCLEVFSTKYPESSWEIPWIHSLFENSAAVASGVEAALKHLGKLDKIRVIAQGGDGGTADIGLQALSGMMERGQDVLYCCYDNEAYMNCLSTSSLIMTKEGLKKITDIKVGDEIYAFDQKTYDLVLKECTGVFDNGIKEVFKLETLHHSIKATGNHPFLVLSKEGENKFLIWKMLENINIGDEVVAIRNTNIVPKIEVYAPKIKEQDCVTSTLEEVDLSESRYFTTEKVRCIKSVGYEPTLDLRVEGEHNFIADGIVAHNTGIQRSGLTPFDSNTTTSPPGKVSFGNPLLKKNMVEICAAHKIPYSATTTVAFPLDVQRKVKKALSIRGPKYLHIHVPCPLGWRHASNVTIEVAKLAVETGLYPLVEFENGKLTSVRKLKDIKPVEEYLKLQGRFKHLFKDEISKQEIAKIQQIADQNIKNYNLLAE